MSDTAFAEVVQHSDKVAQAAAQSVQLPDDERISGVESFRTTGKSWALRDRAR